jgi:hypothetical protein
MYGDIVNSSENLGGSNVILTTLLQMNQDLMNQSARNDMLSRYSEKMQNPQDLNLYSLSAMNLTLVDARDETNIANLVASNKLVIQELLLG